MGHLKIQIGSVIVWIGEQLRHPWSLLRRQTWGVFSEYAHVRRSDRLPKKAVPSREKAKETAEFMARKYGGSYSFYKCLYCEGWHLAKDQIKKPTPSDAKDFFATEPVEKSTGGDERGQSDSSVLDYGRLLKLDIPDIAAVYGGVRGRTMSSKHQDFAWPIIKECGIRTVIDLREDGAYTRLSDLCRKYGMEYFHYPVDNKLRNIGEMIERFPELCRRIDAGQFYIACAMGLHRTDIALCCYWVFYAADRGVPAPEIRGYSKASGHNTDKIMRVLNAFYQYRTEKDGKEPMTSDEFVRRKKTIKHRAQGEG